MILLLLLYGTKSRENNRPNGQTAQCMTPSEIYKKTGTYQGIGQRLIGFVFMFLLWFDGLPLVTLLFICSKLHFEFLQASSD